MKISGPDREIIKFIQGDIPLEPRPFLSLAQSLDLSEDEIIARIRRLREHGIIRRFAAVLAHYRAGFTANAMTAWKIPAEDADEIGEIMASYDWVSHCYLRETSAEFGYNFFTMIHADSDEWLERLTEDMAWRTGAHDYIIIRSVRELKKVSMEYEL